MNRKIFNVVIIAICSAFIITIAATSIVLYSDYKTGAAAAETRFDKLFKQTEETISRTSVPDKQFMDSFKSAIGSTEYYYSINLKSGNQDIYLLSDEPQTSSKLFTVTKSRRITEGSTIDLTLTVVMYAIPTSMVYSRLRITFMVTLFITLLSALCLIYLYATSSNTKSKKKDTNNNDSDNEELEFNEDKIEIPESDEEVFNTQSTDDDLDFNFDSTEEPFTETDNPSIIQEDTYNFATSYVDPDSESDSYSEPSFEQEINQTDEIIIEPETSEQNFNIDNEITSDDSFEEPVIESNSEDTSFEEPAVEETDINSSTETKRDETTENISDSSLFSTKTGFCSEKFLVTRLESELSRASSSELDLSLILIKIPEIDFEDTCGVNCCNQVLNIFHYRDILFEYKDDGIAIIFNGADIDKAMETSEQIYAELCSTLSTHNNSKKPLIGISSRTLRFISGERLIIEAEQALLHAADDSESPIIAFRVNPEKYRKFMANKE